MIFNVDLNKIGLPETPSPSEWLAKSLKNGSLVGVDSTLYSKDEWDTMETELGFSGKRLVSVQNLVDLVWTDRPSRPLNKVLQHPIQYAGKAVADKLDDLRKEMADAGSDLLVITELDEVACKLLLQIKMFSVIMFCLTFSGLLNLRGKLVHIFG